jgi:hypothetical protein
MVHFITFSGDLVPKYLLLLLSTVLIYVLPLSTKARKRDFFARRNVNYAPHVFLGCFDKHVVKTLNETCQLLFTSHSNERSPN